MKKGSGKIIASFYGYNGMYLTIFEILRCFLRKQSINALIFDDDLIKSYLKWNKVENYRITYIYTK